MKRYIYFIGIDTGVNTGVAIWEVKAKSFVQITSLPIHKAFDLVRIFNDLDNCFIRVEDARKRKWFGRRSKEKQQGAGSIKRDAKIWEDFLKDLKVDYEMVAPKNNRTKLNQATFKSITKWGEKTNEHERDAGMLVFGK